MSARWIPCVGLALLFSLVAALPFAALASAEHLADVLTGRTVPDGLGTDPLPTRPATLGVRALPLLSPATEGRISSDGVALDGDTPEEVGRETARALGLDWDDIAELGARQVDRKNTTVAFWDEQLRRDFYPGVDLLVENADAAEHVTTDDARVVDLAGLLLLADAPYANGLAQGLLTYRDAHLASCDRAISAAFLDHLSPAPPTPRRTWPDEAIATACQDDPTASWLAARRLQADAGELDPTSRIREPVRDIPPAALAAATRLTETHPEFPAGLVAHAELLSDLALRERALKVRPFTVRQRLREAEGLLARAAELSSDPQIAVGRAQVLSALGRHDEALAQLDLVDDALLRRQARLEAQVAAGAHDWARAARAYGRVEELRAAPARSRILARRGDLGRVGFMTGAEDVSESAVLTPQQGGPGLPFDGGLLPEHRRYSGGDPSDLALALHLAGDVKGAGAACRDGRAEPICRLIEQDVPAGRITMDSAWDWMLAVEQYQDILRYGGTIEAAVDFLTAVVEDRPDLAQAWSALGEVQLLAGDADGAVASFEEALSDATLIDDAVSQWRLRPGQASHWVALRLALALERSGRLEEAYAVAEASEAPGVFSANRVDDTAAFDYYRVSALARINALSGFAEAALIDWRTAASLAYEFRIAAQKEGIEPWTAAPVLGVAEQNAAAAAAQLGRFDEAVELSQQALAFDPANPLYAETLAEARRGEHISRSAQVLDAEPADDGPRTPPEEPEQQADDVDELIAEYTAVLALDDSLFSSWNNLGVLRGGSGDREGALAAFAWAVRVKPDYALGWFNLGSALSDGDLAQAFAAEGALGKAAQLDPSFRAKGPGLEFDDVVYDAGLDLSRLIPDDWSLGATARPSPVPLTAALVVVIVLRLISSFVQDDVLGRAMDAVTRRGAAEGGIPARLRWLPWWVGVAATFVVVLFAGSASTVAERLFVAPAALGIALLPVLLRPVFAAARLTQRTSVVGLAASGVLITLGIAWPPAPLAASPEAAGAHRRTLAVVALVTAALGACALATGVPAARLAFLACAALLGVLLLPIAPSDGSSLARLWQLAATVGLGGLTVTQALGVI
ncbi:MAG: tetratricopeptide repeat protein [Arachnia sp.]